MVPGFMGCKVGAKPQLTRPDIFNWLISTQGSQYLYARAPVDWFQVQGNPYRGPGTGYLYRIPYRTPGFVFCCYPVLYPQGLPVVFSQGPT